MKLKVFTKKQWKKKRAEIALASQADLEEAFAKGYAEGKSAASDILAAALYQEIVNKYNLAPSVHVKQELIGAITYRVHSGSWFCEGDKTERTQVEVFKKELLPSELESK